jgi:hypothetical protein
MEKINGGGFDAQKNRHPAYYGHNTGQPCLQFFGSRTNPGTNTGYLNRASNRFTTHSRTSNRRADRY